MSKFHPLEVVCRGSETQLQVGENLSNITQHFKGSYRRGAARVKIILWFAL